MAGFSSILMLHNIPLCVCTHTHYFLYQFTCWWTPRFSSVALEFIWTPCLWMLDGLSQVFFFSLIPLQFTSKTLLSPWNHAESFMDVGGPRPQERPWEFSFVFLVALTDVRFLCVYFPLPPACEFQEVGDWQDKCVCSLLLSGPTWMWLMERMESKQWTAQTYLEGAPRSEIDRKWNRY